jgi:hypothetical protein
MNTVTGSGGTQRPPPEQAKKPAKPIKKPKK